MAAARMTAMKPSVLACVPGPQDAIWSADFDPSWTDGWWTSLTAGVDRPKVVLHGGYGKHNLGDDAILDVLLSQIQQHLPTARVTVLAHGPDFVRARYGVPAYHFSALKAIGTILSADLYVIGGRGPVLHHPPPPRAGAPPHAGQRPPPGTSRAGARGGPRGRCDFPAGLPRQGTRGRACLTVRRSARAWTPTSWPRRPATWCSIWAAARPKQPSSR